MNRILRAWEQLSNRMLWLEHFLFYEIILSIDSAWAAHALLTPPGNFETFPASFLFVGALASEHTWGVIVSLGAILKIVGLGLTCFSTEKIQNLSFGMRFAGLGISATFWTLMGISATWGNTDTLFGFPGILNGFIAFWIIIRFPVKRPRRP